MEHTAAELVLYIENDGELYEKQTKRIQKNLAKLFHSKDYQHDKAIKLWEYLATNGARKYSKEIGSLPSYYNLFPKSIRLEAAKILADDFLDELKLGNYDA
jgi:hypothetical protein